MRGSAKCCYPILAYHSRLGFFEAIEEERAKQRQEATLPKEGQKGFQPMLGSNEHYIEEEGKARDIIARSVGLSPTT